MWQSILYYSLASHMRHYLAISALGLCGCAYAPQNPHATALQTWRSPDASLQQRADAVTVLFPIGTSKEEVESVLGRSGRWAHYYGPSFDLINNRPLPAHDFWRLEYEFPSGYVSLTFQPATSFGDRFESASPSFRLTSTPLTNSPCLPPHSSTLTAHP